jgi:predicted component of type VI protein secretion system
MLQFTDQLIICHAPEHIENLGQVSLQVSGAAWPPMSHQPA